MPSEHLLPLTIRPAYTDDQPALSRLAALDSAEVPAGPLMVAEVDGELRAAVAVGSLAAIADPFHLTSDLVSLLRDHIVRSSSAAPRRARRRMLRPAWAA